MNSKTEKPEFFWHKNRKTDLKHGQNRKIENSNAPSFTGSMVSEFPLSVT